MEALQRPTTPGGSLQLSMAANVVSSADPWGLLVTDIYRLNSVKNTNFGLDNKKSFLTHSKIVFGVTDHFCIK